MMTTLSVVVLVLALLLAAAALGLAFFTHRTVLRVEATLPRTGRFVAVPGARLHVREQGQGPAVLLIHGLGGQMGHYTYGVVERLADQFRVVAVDRPGSGYSVRDAATSASLSAQADAFAALIDTLHLDRPLVVGHSLGGAVALALALRHPERISGLALLAPLTHAPDAVPAVFKALTIARPWVRQLLAWTLVTPAVVAQGARVLDQVFGPDPVPHDYAIRGGGMLSLRPSQFLAAATDLHAVPDSLAEMEARYGELRMPVSVLFGRDDRVLDPAAHGDALVAKVPGATLTLIAGGHMLPVTYPELTARFIRDAAARVALKV